MNCTNCDGCYIILRGITLCEKVNSLVMTSLGHIDCPYGYYDGEEHE